MRATISDIAREAGVSTATVDRVLNQRDGVRGRTRDQVLHAAKSLGYIDSFDRPATTPAALDFLLPGGTNTFLHTLAAQIEAAGAQRRDEVSVRVHRVEGFAPEVLARKLDALPDGTDGVAIVALDHPSVREAIRHLVGRGIPVLTLVSDISNVPRCGYIGIDNRAAGRLAGFLLARFMSDAQGKVCLFSGSLSYRGHEEREMGFRHMLAEASPSLTIVQSHEIRDDFELAYRATRTLIERVPDIGGIYNVGAGNRGIARALEEAGLDRRVVYIGHELTEYTRRFLLSGIMDAVIDQNPRLEAQLAIDHLLGAIRQQPSERMPTIATQAIFRENLPAA